MQFQYFAFSDRINIFELYLAGGYSMIALKLKDTKNFMAHLLLKDTFDQFMFIEGEIVTFATFSFDGYTKKEFFTLDEDTDAAFEEYARWKKLKELCFTIIKGKRTPLSFKFIFRLSAENAARLIEREKLDFQPANVQGLYLNLRFENGTLTCTTGTAVKTFTLDKSLEHAWDAMVQKYFDQKEIAYE